LWQATGLAQGWVRILPRGRCANGSRRGDSVESHESSSMLDVACCSMQLLSNLAKLGFKTGRSHEQAPIMITQFDDLHTDHTLSVVIKFLLRWHSQ
jgi:hypothetical protein